MWADEIFEIHQKHWNIKIIESLRKEINSMVVVNFWAWAKSQILYQAVKETKLKQNDTNKKEMNKTNSSVN
jgi:hypothetical protein